MIPPLLVARSRATRLAPLEPLLLVATALLAYRGLLLEGWATPSGRAFEDWLFAPEHKSPAAALAVAGWLAWSRRGRLSSLPGRRDPWTAGLLLALGGGCYAWTLLHHSIHLLLLSLACNLLALASATKGRPGCRVLLLPCAVSLLGAPIPAPIRDELVWQLQLITTSAATGLLGALGFDVLQSGILILRGSYTFVVIASCSGLRGMEILTLVALVIRERFAASGRRQWLLPLVAPALGGGLNLLRVVVVVVVASSGEPRPPDTGIGNHTLQGLGLLLAGTGLLYGLGRRLAGATSRAVRPGPHSEGDAPGVGSATRWRAPALVCACLAVLSLAIDSSPPARGPLGLELPEERSGWRGADLGVDRAFFGALPSGSALHRRYERPLPDAPPEVVFLFVAFEVEGSSATSGLLSSRSAVPGRAWSVAPGTRTHIDPLGLDAEAASATRDGEQAIVYSWRLRDAGLWRETARSVLGLDSGPSRRDPQRAVVRLVTPLRDEAPETRQRALETLDRFIRDFRTELAGL